MKKSIYVALIACAVSALSACSSYHYYKAGDDYLSLNKYHTFAWAPTDDHSAPDANLNRQRPPRRQDDFQNAPPRRPDNGNFNEDGPRMRRGNGNMSNLGARLNEVNNNKYYNNPEAAKKIQDATISTLQSKGLVMQQNNPDLLVRYTTMVDRGSRNSYGGYPYGGGLYGWGWGGGLGWRYPYIGLGWGWGGGYGWGGYGYGGYPVQEHFKEGVLAIELIDSRTHQTVWIGYGAGELSRNSQKAIAQLPQVVSDIFKQLPVNNDRMVNRM